MPSAGAPVLAGDFTRHYCKATQGTQQSIANGAWVSLQFDDADTVDTLGVHDPVTNNSRFLIGLLLGWWEVIGHVSWASGAAGNRLARIAVNGVPSNGAYQFFSLTATNLHTNVVSAMVQATSAGDYVELQGQQGSGAALTTRVSAELRSQMLVKYLGP